MENSISVCQLLREPDAFFERVRRGQVTQTQTIWLAVLSALCLAVFGSVVGLAHSPWQAISSALKMPALVMGVGLLCLPALYLFSLAVGTRLTMTQVAAVLLAGVSVTSVLLLGLAPVIVVFVFTSSNYAFLQLLAVVSVAVTACIGLYYLWRGVEHVKLFERANSGSRRLMMGAWCTLYAFVGSQIGWRLSPLVGDPSQPFFWLQPSHDNLYVDVVHALESALGWQVTAFGSQPMWLGGLCFLPLVLLVVSAGLATFEEA
jgi:hypothetical protein